MTLPVNQPIDHHYLPVFYLKQWCGGGGKVVRYYVPIGAVVSHDLPSSAAPLLEVEDGQVMMVDRLVHRQRHLASRRLRPASFFREPNEIGDGVPPPRATPGLPIGHDRVGDGGRGRAPERGDGFGIAEGGEAR